MNQQRPKTKPLRYFFYRGDLHKKIHIHRPNDLVTAWNYKTDSVQKYVYSDVRRNGEQAFSTRQVEILIGRSQTSIKTALRSGMVHTPQLTYGLDENRNGYAYYWCEKDIMELRDYFASVHHGRPRKDGMVTPKDLP